MATQFALLLNPSEQIVTKFTNIKLLMLILFSLFKIIVTDKFLKSKCNYIYVLVSYCVNKTVQPSLFRLAFFFVFFSNYFNKELW